MTLPVLLLIAFGTIETCGAVFAKQSLQSAAQECAREAALPSATLASVRARLDEFSARRDLSSVVLTMTPSDPAGLPAGTTLVVSLSLPAEEVGLIAGQFLSGEVEASCTVVKSF